LACVTNSIFSVLAFRSNSRADSNRARPATCSVRAAESRASSAFAATNSFSVSNKRVLKLVVCERKTSHARTLPHNSPMTPLIASSIDAGNFSGWIPVSSLASAASLQREMPMSQASRFARQLMPRMSKLLLVLLLGIGSALWPPSGDLMASSRKEPAPDKAAPKATRKTASASAPDIPFYEHDDEAEQQLLQLANQARAEVGVPPLVLDRGLSQAARRHAQAMFQARDISHQFDGEPSLAHRLAAASNLLLEQNGENVALDTN